MKTRILPACGDVVPMDVIRQAAEVLRHGGVVAFPTETVYGLGADALNARAVHRIFEAKGRPANNPLIVHVASVAQARRVVARWPRAARLLARRFWPGPLTLILPKRREVPDAVTAGLPSVAVRCPAHPVAAALIRAAGTPIAAPSANRSTRVSPTRAAHCMRQLSGRIPLILDGGPTSGGIESTVLDLTGGQPRILRPGPVTAAQLRRALGQPVTAIAAGPAHPQDPLPSPGMMARHYAPRIPLHCAPSDTADREARRLARGGLRVGRLAIGTPARTTPVGGGMVLTMPRTPRAYAARLYAALHEMEDSGVDCIVADMPPETHAWEAVRDRLRRASAR